MPDILFQLNSFHIYTFGVFLAVAYLLGAFLFWRQGRREGFASDDLLDLLFLSSLAGLAGGRVFFLFAAGKALDPMSLLKLGDGFLWAGAIAGGTAAAYVFIQSRNWSFFRIADITVCALAAAQAVGFLGLAITGDFATFPYLFSGYFALAAGLNFTRKYLLPGISFLAYLFFSGLLIYFAETVYPVTGLALTTVGIMGAIALGIRFWLKRRNK